MINLLYEPFPETVRADGAELAVLTDFREWIRFADLVNDPELGTEEKVQLLGLWFADVPEYVTKAHVDALCGFYKALPLEPDTEEADADEETPPRPPTFDWQYDARYVLGDFRRFYGIDLLQTGHLHWWAFKSLFLALPDESSCMRRMGYRSADLSRITNKAEKNRIARIQKAIALPFTLDDDMIGEMLWNAI